jgi:hypothetical protein
MVLVAVGDDDCFQQRLASAHDNSVLASFISLPRCPFQAGHDAGEHVRSLHLREVSHQLAVGAGNVSLTGAPAASPPFGQKRHRLAAAPSVTQQLEGFLLALVGNGSGHQIAPLAFKRSSRRTRTRPGMSTSAMARSTRVAPSRRMSVILIAASITFSAMDQCL